MNYHKIVYSVAIAALVIIFLRCSASKTEADLKYIGEIPNVEREFRAAWIATVANINWPSKPGLTTEEQKNEVIELLDLLQKNNFNAAIFQVRPQCDAFYKSELEPWSFYLTGEQGKAPDPYYDPLEFWIEQAHLRGLELHVWLNPYRAHHVRGGEVTDFSIVKTHPELVVKLKKGYYWLDPGNPGTREHSLAVAMDIVERYDIDGVHMDDYFYPYPEYNNGEDFPDSVSWQKYLRDGGDLSRGDWRRQNVNTFIEELYFQIKSSKEYVKFGISPFGIWRPNYPKSIKGFDQYEKLFADAKLWLNEGWVDYYTPQLYWRVNRIPQSFPVLLGWWSQENYERRHLWPGINIGVSEGEKRIDEVVNQIMITRGMIREDPGTVHWSIGPLKDSTLAQALLEGPYKNQALVPASPWLDDEPPVQPEVSLSGNNEELTVRWTCDLMNDVNWWVVYFKNDNSWNYKIFGKDSHEYKFSDKDENYSISHIAVSAVDRTGNESEKSIIRLDY